MDYYKMGYDCGRNLPYGAAIGWFLIIEVIIGVISTVSFIIHHL